MSCLKKLITLLKLKVHKFILISLCFVYKNPGAFTSTYKDCSGRTMYTVYMQCILKTVGVHAETKNIFLIPIIAFIIGI